MAVTASLPRMGVAGGAPVAFIEPSAVAFGAAFEE